MEVIDGDTVEVVIDLGFRAAIRQVIRLYGIDAPDRNDPVGQEIATRRLRELLPENAIVTLRTIKTKAGKDRTEKYGRFMGIFVVNEGEVNSMLVAEGVAKGNYFGGKRD